MILDKSIGLVCVDTIWYDKTIFAIEQTLKCVDVDKIYWFSDIECPKKFDIDIEWIKINKIRKDYLMYDNGIIYTKVIPKYIDTDFGLYIHSDGFAVNKEMWDDRFLDYDYIGAPWPFYELENSVGNGGFCIKSKKLHEVIQQININEHLLGVYPEDNIICRFSKKILQNDFNINFAPLELSCKFSMENYFEYPYQAYNFWIGKSFGFHGGFAVYYGFNYKNLKGEI